MHSAKRRYLVIVLLAALFAALPLLAWMQYRWIGEAGRAEIERTRAGLRRAAGQMASEFDDELSRLLAMVVATAEPGDKDRNQYATRFTEWRSVTSHSKLVRDLFLTEGGQNGLGLLYRWNREHHSFEAAEWPAELEPLRSELSTRSRPGSEVRPPGMPGSSADVPALIAPRSPLRRLQFRTGPPPEDRPGDDGGFPPGIDQRRPPPGRPPPISEDGWVIAWLDLDYARSQWLPELVRKYFTIDGQPEYDVRIVSRVSGSVVFDSNPSVPAEAFRTPDAEATMFQLHGGVPNRREGPPDPPVNAEAPGAGRWRLLVRDRSGPVEEAVARTRLRNLAVSGAVLLIMASSLVALLFAMRRADQLAVQQMQFVAAVSHELRTPLAVIRSAAENLADGIVTGAEPVKEYGVVIREEGRRLSYLVEQTLRFAGIQTGRARYNLTPVDVAAVLDDALKSCEGVLRNSGCRIDTTIDPGLPRVLADPSSLAVCIGNLLTNAAKHAGAGQWIGIRASTPAGHDVSCIHIQVSDRGPGIESRDLPHIFEPFYRGRCSQSNQIAGTGLGLALVRQIITAHNGDIAVTSRVGEGSCFTLTIPAVDPEFA